MKWKVWDTWLKKLNQGKSMICHLGSDLLLFKSIIHPKMDLKWSSKVPRKKFSIIYGLGAVHGTRFDSKNAVLWSDFRLLWTPNFQKLKNAISLENGKWPSWISHMFWLTYGAQCSAKKNSEKIRCRVVFWPGRKIGRNHGPARLRLKIGEFQKKNLLQVFATLWTIDG